jgi:hypothetical protein
MLFVVVVDEEVVVVEIEAAGRLNISLIDLLTKNS